MSKECDNCGRSENYCPACSTCWDCVEDSNEILQQVQTNLRQKLKKAEEERDSARNQLLEAAETERFLKKQRDARRCCGNCGNYKQTCYEINQVDVEGYLCKLEVFTDDPWDCCDKWCLREGAPSESEKREELEHRELQYILALVSEDVTSRKIPSDHESSIFRENVRRKLHELVDPLEPEGPY